MFSFFGLVLFFSTITFLTFFILSSVKEFAIFVKVVEIIMYIQIYLSGPTEACFFIYPYLFLFLFLSLSIFISISISISLRFCQESTTKTTNLNFFCHLFQYNYQFSCNFIKFFIFALPPLPIVLIVINQIIIQYEIGFIITIPMIDLNSFHIIEFYQ